MGFFCKSRRACELFAENMNLRAIVDEREALELEWLEAAEVVD